MIARNRLPAVCHAAASAAWADLGGGKSGYLVALGPTIDADRLAALCRTNGTDAPAEALYIASGCRRPWAEQTAAMTAAIEVFRATWWALWPIVRRAEEDAAEKARAAAGPNAFDGRMERTFEDKINPGMFERVEY